MSGVLHDISALVGRHRPVAAAHRQGAWWRVVVAEITPQPRVIFADSIPAAAPRDILATAERHRCGRLVLVAPSASTLARLVELPEGPESDLAAALELMAEAELPDRTPDHRRGWGHASLPSVDGFVSAMLIAVLGELDGPTSTRHTRVTWTGEPAALAGLLAPDAGGYALSADRELGSIGIVAAGHGPSVVRTCREWADDTAAWRSLVDATAAECGVDARGGPADQIVAIDEESRGRLAGRIGFPIGPEWIESYAVAAGAALGAAGEGAASALFELHDQPPTPPVGPDERFVRALRAPARAWTLVAACVALMVFGYLGASLLRASALDSKLEAVATSEADTEGLQRRAAFFAALDQRRWPMTKLLAELSRAAPVGVEAETIRMAVGEEIVFRGVADDSGKLSGFVKSLNDTGVFQARVSREESAEEGFEFEMSVAVTSPWREAKSLEDFAEKTLGHRLYGEEYDAVASAERAREAEAEEKRQARATGRGSTGSRSDRIFDGSDRRGEQPAEPAPEPLTDEALAAMDEDAVRTEFGDRVKAASRQDLDDETRRRLKEEVDRIRARLRELKGGG